MSGGPLDFDPEAGRRSGEERPAEEAPRPREGRRTDAERLFQDGGPPSGDRPPPATLAVSPKYGWFVGIVFLAVIAYVTINSLSSNGPGSRGLRPGEVAPVFAAPLALGNLDGDVNVARTRNAGSAGHVPACDVRGPSVLNQCDLVAKGPAVLAFFVTRDGRCIDTLDRLDALRRRHPHVAFAAVAIRGGHEKTRSLVQEHRWGFPVAFDRDGALANLYGIAVCPVVTYLHRGGRVAGVTLGDAKTPELDRDLRALEAGRTIQR